MDCDNFKPFKMVFSAVGRKPENISLDAFKRDKKLTAIRKGYVEHNNHRILVENLDEFFIESELYRDVPIKKSTLEKIREEDLNLIAYEVFG